MVDLDIEVVEQKDKRLGRHKVHDPRSRRHPHPRTTTIDTSTWRTVSIAGWDPRPNPNQPVGCCTGVDWCVRFNTRGKRKKGRVLNMDDAIRMYSGATHRDPWQGEFPPNDTGSYGLAVAEEAIAQGEGGEYLWNFARADGVVQVLCDDDDAVGCGTWWYSRMFDPIMRNGRPWIEPGGSREGGHQYTARGYIEPLDAIIIRCWWGPGFRDVLISRVHLDELLADGGDSIVQEPAATVSVSPEAA